MWASEGLLVSLPCLLWLESQEPEVLVAGCGDHHLRVWKMQRAKGAVSLALQGTFGAQQGPITALAQSTTYVASASGQSTHNPLL